MNDPAGSVCEDVVRRVLARNGETGAGQALGALLGLLRERHLAEVKAFAARAFREGFELPDPAAATAAEEVRDLAAGGARATDLGMQAVAGLLGELIALWDFEGGEGKPDPQPYARPAPCASR